METCVVILLLLLLVIYIYRTIDPKFDWNQVTGERILWYNDPFDSYIRKAVTVLKGD